MRIGKGVLGVVAVWAVLMLAPGLSFADNKVLNGDEIKALITGKTVHVTRKNDGAQWKIFFDVNGKAISSQSGEGTWDINGSNEHCNSGVNLNCAKISDNGDGTYSRLKPNGDIAVIWTKIVNGKDM